MGINKTFALIAVAVSTAVLFGAGCSREGSGFDPIRGDGTTRFLSVDFAAGTSTPSRAAGGAGTAPGENFVDEVYLVLINLDQNRVQYQLPLRVNNVAADGDALVVFNGMDMAADPGAPAATSTGFTSKACQVEYKQYDLLVLVNPTQAMKDGTAVGTDRGQVLAAKAADVDELRGAGGKRFAMSNGDGLIPILPSDLRPTASEAERTPIAVNVDRALAKVTAVADPQFEANVTANTTGPAPKYKALTELGWYVDVENPVTYWMRRPTFIRGGSSPEVPGRTPRSDYYAEDPNMTEAENQSAGFVNKGLFDQTLEVNPGDGTGADVPVWVYVPENTMNITQQSYWKQYGTHVVFRCKIQPNQLAAGESYYSYDGYVFTHSQSIAWLFGSAQVPSGVPAADADAWLAILRESGFFPSSGTAQPAAFTVADNGLTFHHDSWNFYRIPIKHFGEGGGTYGDYGVVRNNVYTVNLVNISGPGDGETEEGSRFISAHVTIEPWYMRDQQDEDLGERPVN